MYLPYTTHIGRPQLCLLFCHHIQTVLCQFWLKSTPTTVKTLLGPYRPPTICLFDRQITHSRTQLIGSTCDERWPGVRSTSTLYFPHFYCRRLWYFWGKSLPLYFKLYIIKSCKSCSYIICTTHHIGFFCCVSQFGIIVFTWLQYKYGASFKYGLAHISN